MPTEAETKNFQTGKKFVLVCRQLEGLIRVQYPGIKPIDIDIAPPVHIKKTSMPNIETGTQKMLEVAGEFDQSLKDGKFLYRKALGMNAFLGDLERHQLALQKARRGLRRDAALEVSLEARLPWKEYCEAVGGFIPVEIPIEVIEDQYTRTSDAFQELGFKFNRDGWAEFFKDAVLSAEDFKKAFEAEDARLTEIYGREIRIPKNIGYKSKIEKENASWVNWITGGRSSLVLKTNTHPRNGVRLFIGNHGISVVHEKLAHIIQARKIQNAIDEGLINPGYGIMMVPGLEQYAAEGIALTLPYWVRPLLDALTPHERFALEYTQLRNLAQGKLAYDLHKDNSPSRRELAQYALHYLPPETKERIVNFMNEVRYDPVGRGYKPAYHNGGYRLLLAAGELSEVSQLKVVNRLLECPMMPTDVDAMICQMKKEERGKPLAKAS